ncbi:hypothetical protein glysoja_037779 [Glycine soja]|uniref:Uncharacterized protein n=1 Tax=Glycine soja TaxID=3848 RepID=A0A0B2SS18_GLYSO|nr:hypothetical protein glysoja_037779 [Glycine soja]
MLRRVDEYLQEYLTQKSRMKESFPDMWSARSANNGNIGTDERVFDPPRSLASSRAVVGKILCQRSLQMCDQQRAWQVIFTENTNVVCVLSF